MKKPFLKPVLLVLVMTFLSIASAQDGWPVRFEADGNEYQLFAPQPESMDGTKFSARAAISMKRPQDRSPVFGAIWADAALELDRGSRLGRLTRYDVNDARFPGVDDQQELAGLRRSLSRAIPANAPPISIDWLISALEEEQQAGDQYMNDPPDIIYRNRPSALVFIDGDPIYEELDDTVMAQGDPLYQPKSRSRLERVVNTPFTLVRIQNGDHYLYGSRMWFRSRSIDGPWQRDESVPSELQQLAARISETAAITADDQPATMVTDIVVRYSPTELIDVDGEPNFQPVQNTNLLTLTNTTRSVFMDINSQEYYFLASGRWFRSRDLAQGPWTYVPSDRLPEEFRKIPEGSNRDMVLAHVAGTDAAREASRDANIPQTAQVDRHNSSVDVTYRGAPEFERITGTSVEFARNASTDVLRINGRYHVCDNGVWYEGPTPDGPWTVSTVVPAEVQSIPPSSPVYNTRYVYIYDHTPDVVFMGYTPGYLGSYVQHGVVVYGTGFYYRPWPGFWRPRPWTWGFNMYYDPWFGWGFGAGWGYNWFHPGWGMWGPNPYAWGWWGPHAYHPPCCMVPTNTVYGHRPSVAGRTGRSAMPEGATRATRSGDLYSEVRREGVRPTTVQRERGAEATQPARRPAARGQDHFTDAAGNIYRQSGDRTQRYENGSWNRVQQPAPTTAPARDRGAAPPVQRQPAPTREQPSTRPQQGRPAAPQQARPDPFQIQRDRQRGIQRQENYQQRTPPRTRPAPQPRATPAPSPSRSPGGVSPGGRGGGGAAPSRGGGGGSAPSRGGGGGRR